jgi:hypothetical protein
MQPGIVMVHQSFLALALAFLIFRLVQPDRAFFARRNPLTPETRYAKPSPTVGMLDVLAPFSSMSVLLAPKGVVSGFVSGRFPRCHINYIL